MGGLICLFFRGSLHHMVVQVFMAVIGCLMVSFARIMMVVLIIVIHLFPFLLLIFLLSGQDLASSKIHYIIHLLSEFSFMEEFGCNKRTGCCPSF